MPPACRAALLCSWMGLMVLLCLPPAPTTEEIRSESTAPLRHLGEAIGWTPAQVNDTLETLVEPWRGARSLLSLPRDGLALVGIKQGWTMFSGVDTTPSRLIIEVDEGGWRAIYTTGDPALQWNARLFDEARMRSVVNHAGKEGRSSKRRWLALTDWLAPRVLAAHPEASRVRFAMLRQRMPAPAELRSEGWPDGKRTRSRTVSR